MKRKLTEKGVTPEECSKQVAKDNSGSIEIIEIGQYFSDLKLAEALALMKYFDENGDKCFSLEEFEAVFDEVDID